MPDDARLTEEERELLKDAAEVQYLQTGKFDYENLSSRSVSICGQFVSAEKMANLSKHGRWARSAKATKDKFDVLADQNKKEPIRGESEIAEESMRHAVVLKRIAQVMAALADQSMHNVIQLINQAAQGDPSAKAMLSQISPADPAEAAKMTKMAADLFALGHALEVNALPIVAKDRTDPLSRGNLGLLTKKVEDLTDEEFLALASSFRSDE